jgi:NADH:ubiquinone oxidoreductase subunit E
MKKISIMKEEELNKSNKFLEKYFKRKQEDMMLNYLNKIQEHHMNLFLIFNILIR